MDEIPCDPARCEVKAWSGGAAGACNHTTQLCECPFGYSGRYVLNPSNTCHFNHSFKRSLNTALFSVNAVASLILTFYVILVALQLSRLRKRPVLPAQSSIDQKPADRFRRVVITAHRASLLRRVVKRKRIVLLNLLMYYYFVLCDLHRTSSMMVDVDIYADKFPPVVALLYGSSAAAILCGLYTTAYLHYTSIPNAAILAERVGIRSIYVSYPNLIYWVIHVNLGICIAVITGFTVAYMHSLRFVVDNFTMILCILFAILYYDGLFVYYTIHALKSALFKQIIRSSRNQYSIGRMKTALFRLDLFLSFLLCFTVGQTAFGIVATSDRRWHFLLFTVFTILYNILCVVFGFFLLFDHVRNDRDRSVLEPKANTISYKQ